VFSHHRKESGIGFNLIGNGQALSLPLSRNHLLKALVL
jgi:hypothetical protein